MVSSPYIAPAATQGAEFFPCSIVGSLLQEIVSHEYSNISPSRGQCFSTNCCSVGRPCLGCSPSRTGYFSMGPPYGHKSYQQETCSNMGIPGDHSLLSGIKLWVSSKGWGWISAVPWSSMGWRGTAASLWAPPGAVGASQLWCPEHLLCLLLQWYRCLQSNSSHIFSIHSSLAAIKTVQNFFFYLLRYVYV